MVCCRWNILGIYYISPSSYKECLSKLPLPHKLTTRSFIPVWNDASKQITPHLNNEQKYDHDKGSLIWEKQVALENYCTV
jgi:hypothetical protein